MKDLKETNKKLQEILELLNKFEVRDSGRELTAQGNNLIEKAEKNGEEATRNLQNSFDRIHDKLFTLNGVLVPSYFGLGKFPEDEPVINLWSALLPIFMLFFLIFLEQKQMTIHRHASQIMNWNFDKDVEKYGEMIKRQNQKSLLGIIITLVLFLHIAFKVITY